MLLALRLSSYLEYACASEVGFSLYFIVSLGSIYILRWSLLLTASASASEILGLMLGGDNALPCLSWRFKAAATKLSYVGSLMRTVLFLHANIRKHVYRKMLNMYVLC